MDAIYVSLTKIYSKKLQNFGKKPAKTVIKIIIKGNSLDPDPIRPTSFVANTE